MSEKKAKKRQGGFGGPPGGALVAGAEKPKDFKGAFRKLWNHVRRYRLLLIAAVIFTIASAAFSILGPKILGLATTRIFDGVLAMIAGTGSIDFGYVGRILLTLTILYVISLGFSYAQGFIMNSVAMKVTYEMRREIGEKIQRLPLKYFDKKSYGEVLSYITNDVDTISQSLNQSLAQIINSISLFIGILIMMLTISWQLTLVALLIVPLAGLFITFIVKKSQRHFNRQQDYLGHINGHIEEIYGNHGLVQAFNGEEAARETFEDYNRTLYHSAWRSQFASGLIMPVMNFIGNIAFVVICILGGYMAVNGRMTVGNIQAFTQYVRQFTQPITQIANISNVLQQTAAAAERVFTFLDEEEEVPETAHPASVQQLRGEIVFDHVSFGYDPAVPVIRDFSATIKPGQKVAIVGPTGAGKTTIVKLLMRFYELQSGAIRLDGVDTREFTRNDLRKTFGMVLQDTWVYHDTVRENIRYGNLAAGDDAVVRAAEAAQVDHFVRTLPEGYGMVLNEETSNVSQGQKQLLTIARVILADPKVLILDEATSSVDTRTEVLIQKAMDHLMEGRTSFIIAHRLSTIRDADLILVMKEGDIVEQGSHKELLKRGGHYAELYNSQFQ